ncbi:iron uptake transporter deferrochelatase/peroxidase subunit [Paenibacillus glycanilyticus]|uniref:Deferrochelatase n=1 Tax=Paenibacillus glycanilyticus TaxID=126569 RepID=A0ABQ6GBA1_9BACL|nr:iron uptake transporter deferrochelatase/peroxidase subunit [Paenibacillus glycanilyticus]GLX66932.1 deferrochelatase [Paenibacillus glycanilyticus]
MSTEENQPAGSTISRRDFLKLTTSVGFGLAIGAAGMASINEKLIPEAKSEVNKQPVNDVIAMYGDRQAGIITPQQKYMYLVSFRITTSQKADVIQLFKSWTKFSDLSTSGGTMKTGDNPLLPPSDTGETLELSASNLTITYGFGPTFFLEDGKDRFGIAKKQPLYLKDIPRMPRENIDPSLSGGDVCLQVCADDQQVAFHAVRNFIRLSTGYATLNWLQEGFISGKAGVTPRNLFGFKDGTANKLHDNPEGNKKVIWAGQEEPSWMTGGSYMSYRKIRMLLEVWDRSSLSDQENTFGRHKESGAAFGKTNEFEAVDSSKLPVTSHVALAKQSGQLIHRRGYSYTDGVDPKTGNVNAGLLFIGYSRNPEEQLIPMLKLMQSKDKLNAYTSHIASGMFACPGGLTAGQYMGQSLME